MSKTKATIYEMKVFREGCGYIVEKPGDFCMKCKHDHIQTYLQAELQKEVERVSKNIHREWTNKQMREGTGIFSKMEEQTPMAPKDLKLEIGKIYEDTDGWRWEILALDGPGEYPVVGVMRFNKNPKDDSRSTTLTWTLDGRHYIHEGATTKFDLVREYKTFPQILAIIVCNRVWGYYANQEVAERALMDALKQSDDAQIVLYRAVVDEAVND